VEQQETSTKEGLAASWRVRGPAGVFNGGAGRSDSHLRCATGHAPAPALRLSSSGAIPPSLVCVCTRRTGARFSTLIVDCSNGILFGHPTAAGQDTATLHATTILPSDVFTSPPHDPRPLGTQTGLTRTLLTEAVAQAGLNLAASVTFDKPRACTCIATGIRQFFLHARPEHCTTYSSEPPRPRLHVLTCSVGGHVTFGAS
jgi:hypothetical protein